MRMVGVSGSGGSFCRHVSADEARRPAGDDGECPVNAHRASLLSLSRARTHTHTAAVIHDESATCDAGAGAAGARLPEGGHRGFN